MGKASKALVSVSVLPLVACLMMSGAAASEGQSRPSEPISGDAAETSEQTSVDQQPAGRSEEHTSELQSLMRTSYAVFCLKKKTTFKSKITITQQCYP